MAYVENNEMKKKTIMKEEANENMKRIMKNNNSEMKRMSRIMKISQTDRYEETS